MTERQKFDLLKEVKASNKVQFEIRRYHSCVMADVIVNSDYGNAANLGFRPLVTYISQNNIAMTAPVLQEEKSAGSWTVSFVMPADAKIEDLPLPKNSSVTLRTIPEHTAAALSFRGFTTDQNIKKREAELREALDCEAISVTGPMRIARFDPPWKPAFARHNEVVIPIIFDKNG